MEKNLESPLILASKSPRRKELLKNAGLKFVVVPSSLDENTIKSSDPVTYAKLLAETKAEYVSQKYPNSWIIGADTIVVIDGNILEKPRTICEARRMLHLLKGKIHHVHTGYAIICQNKSHFFSDTVTTTVLFKALSEQEIEWYIHTAEPYDKAGGYAIQGLGSFMIKHITGCYANVVGLPVCELIDHLFKHGAIIRNPVSFSHINLSAARKS